MKCSEIKSKARESLTNKWGKAALITFCYFVIEFLINFMISGSKGSLPFLSSLLSIGNTVISVTDKNGTKETVIETGKFDPSQIDEIFGGYADGTFE